MVFYSILCLRLVRTMKCLKCLNKCNGTKPRQLPDILSHLADYTICRACDDRLEKAREKYKKHSKYYKNIQESYRKKMKGPYIKRLMADNSILKPKDIPEQLVQAKKQELHMKRILKED